VSYNATNANASDNSVKMRLHEVGNIRIHMRAAKLGRMTPFEGKIR